MTTWRLFDCEPCDCSCGMGECCIERADACSHAVEERSRLTVEDVRAELGIPVTITDARLARWLLAAKQAADRYLANGFCGGAIPESVELGILAYVEVLAGLMPAGSSSLGARGIASQSVGSVSISYEARSAAGGTMNDAQAAAEGWWAGFRALVFATLGGCVCGGCKC